MLLFQQGDDYGHLMEEMCGNKYLAWTLTKLVHSFSDINVDFQ